MNNRGFSLMELLAVIVILGIVMSIAVVSYNAVVSNTETKVYKNYENSMKSGVMMYIIDNGVPASGMITLEELLLDKRVDYFKNPKSNDQCLTSYVEITKNNNDNTNLSYKVCLICPEYKSSGC